MFILKYVVVSFVYVAANGLCPDRWTQFGNSCYFLYYDDEAWGTANAICATQDGHLVSITSSEENQFIKSLVKTREGSRHDVWIGANDLMSEGIFTWIGTDEKMSFTDWHKGEPSSSTVNENCVEMEDYRLYQWNDETCSMKQHFICERRYVVGIMTVNPTGKEAR